MSKIDIFVYLTDKPVQAKKCIEALISHTSNMNNIFFLGDRISTSLIRYLMRFCGRSKNGAMISFLNNHALLGYAASFNKAIRASKEPTVAVLRMTDIVSMRWLDKMVTHMNETESDIVKVVESSCMLFKREVMHKIRALDKDEEAFVKAIQTNGYKAETISKDVLASIELLPISKLEQTIPITPKPSKPIPTPAPLPTPVKVVKTASVFHESRTMNVVVNESIRNQAKRIVYIDDFSYPNSNPYWEKSFQNTGGVQRINITEVIRDRSWPSLPKIFKKLNPTHVHCGGSIKDGSRISVGLIRWIREEFPQCRITYFYGDACWKYHYYDLVEPYVDRIFVSSLGWVKNSKYSFLPCPAPSESYRPWNENKEYDIVFIGNNYSEDRLREIRALSKKYKLTVFGGNWPKDINCAGRCTLKEYPDICSKAKIVLGDPAGAVCRWSAYSHCVQGDPDSVFTNSVCRELQCSAFEELVGYQSNRMFNTLMAGATYVVPYVTRLEEIVTNQEVAWYKTKKEQDTLIDELLADPRRRKQIALAGQKKVKDSYTFDACAQIILEGE